MELDASLLDSAAALDVATLSDAVELALVVPLVPEQAVHTVAASRAAITMLATELAFLIA